ncbi:3-oxoacyl-[acyl-carrier-protein] reductase FabG [Varanus komodoensis]|nr:3-oxoacyl-[acyl-carrier-protein] reductase FabG [Varanus komodoensis]
MHVSQLGTSGLTLVEGAAASPEASVKCPRMPRLPETPIWFIVEHLKKAREMVRSIPGVPDELQHYLEKALDAARELAVSSKTGASSNRIVGLDRRAREQHLAQDEVQVIPWDVNWFFLPSWLRTSSSMGAHLSVLHSETEIKTNEEQFSCYPEGQLHKMLVRMLGAKRVLAVGMLDVPSLLAMAKVIPGDGSITICAAQPSFGESLQEVLDFSSPGNKIKLNVGPILDILKELAAVGEDFDIIFIDADQKDPTENYHFVMENHLLRMDGMLCVENTLMKGHAYLENTADENVLDVKKLNQVINSDPRIEQVFLPVQGGLILLHRSQNCIDEETNPNVSQLYVTFNGSPLVPLFSRYQKGVVKDEVFWGYQQCCILDRLRLDGKVAYVTGGGQGIGRGFCHALGEAGAKVAVVDLEPARAEAVALELSLKGIKSIAIAADISKPEEIQQMLDTIVAKWGTVHIACNNAGINMNSPSEATSLEEWDRTFNVNLRGLFLCCQAAGRIMLNQGYGKIINTASMASLIVPHPQKQLAYNASKAGVVKLTQTLGTEWIDRGVRVNCISPGIVNTPLIHSEELKPLVQRWLADIPAGRLAQVTDLQAAVVYLASEASDYMTGHNLAIEGGQSLW